VASAAVARLRPRLHRRPATIALAAAAVVLVELAVAAGVSDPRFARLGLLLAACAGIAAVLALPLGATIALLVAASSLFHAAFFARPLGPVDVRLPEVLLLSLLVAALAAPRRQTWGGVPGAALGVFLGVVALSGTLAVLAGRVSATDAFNWGRPLVFYASFWVVLRLFPDAASLRRLLLTALACGALTGVLAMVLQLAPGLVDTFQGPGGQQIYTQATEAGLGSLKRIRQPGLALSYMLFWWSLLAAMTARPGLRTLMWLLVGASCIDILLSFNRNMWLGLVFGIALMLVLSGVHLRRRIVAGVVLGVAAAVLTFAVVGNGGDSAQLDPIVARAGTVLSPQELSSESSLRDRTLETAQAWRTIQAHPLTGVGVGADFGVRFNHDEGNGIWVNTVQHFLHDQWLWLLLIGGIPALLAFATFIAAVLARAWSRRARTLSQTALGTGLAMVAVSAFVQPYLGVQEYCLGIGVVAAVLVRAHELELASRLS
jgi:O-antigen ligase